MNTTKDQRRIIFNKLLQTAQADMPDAKRGEHYTRVMDMMAMDHPEIYEAWLGFMADWAPENRQRYPLHKHCGMPDPESEYPAQFAARQLRTIRRGTRIGLWSFAFILAETIVFLFIDGWHYHASGPAERLCDHIGDAGIALSLILYAIACLNTAEHYLESIT